MIQNKILGTYTSVTQSLLRLIPSTEPTPVTADISAKVFGAFLLAENHPPPPPDAPGCKFSAFRYT